MKRIRSDHLNYTFTQYLLIKQTPKATAFSQSNLTPFSFKMHFTLQQTFVMGFALLVLPALAAPALNPTADVAIARRGGDYSKVVDVYGPLAGGGDGGRQGGRQQGGGGNQQGGGGRQHAGGRQQGGGGQQQGGRQ